MDVKSHTRSRKAKSKREELYADILVRNVTIPLSAKQHFCEYCNAEMVTIDYTEVREKLRITSAKVERIK